MEAVWYYVVNGSQTGPVSFAELKAVAASGKLSPHDLVWQEGTPDWVPASSVAGLLTPKPPTPPAPPIPTYSLSAPESKTEMLPPSPANRAPEPLSLDDDNNKPRRRKRERGDDLEPLPAQTPEWITLSQLFIRRAFNPNPSTATPTAEEEKKLATAGIMDATARQIAVWRRAILFVAAVPCGFAAFFGLINLLAMDENARAPYSAFGMLLLYLQTFAVFALPVTAVFAALAFDRFATSTKWVQLGGVVSFAVPLAIAFVPTDWLLDIPTNRNETVASAEMNRGFLGIVMGIMFYIALMPAVLSLLPAVARACVRTKLALPESLVPGWGLVTSVPLCVLLTLATFVVLYHAASNALLIVGLLLWIGSPLLYLTKFELFTRPVSNPADRAIILRTSLTVFFMIAGGMVLLVIYMFTAKFMGQTILGFDEKSLVRPWTLRLHTIWIEYVGRSLFLTVFFSDLLLRISLSVWREERAFANSPECVNFDRTMTGLGSAILPRGNPLPPG